MHLLLVQGEEEKFTHRWGQLSPTQLKPQVQITKPLFCEA